MSPERIKSVRNSMLISSIVLLLLGIAFIVWPGEAARTLARIIAAVITLVAAFEIVMFFFARKKGFTDISAILTGTVLAILGIYLLVKPDSLLNFFNIIFGIIIIIMGLDHLFQAIFIIRHIRGLWWVTLIVGIAAVAMGVIILINPFSVATTAMTIIGISMVVEALGGFWNLPALKARPETAADAPVTKNVDSSDDDLNA